MPLLGLPVIQLKSMTDRVGLNDLIELLRGARERGDPIPDGLIERERRNGDPVRLAGALTLAGLRSQDPVHGIEWTTEAVELFTVADCDCVELEFTALNVLGVFLDDLGRYDEALASFESALARAEKDDYILGISKAQHNLCFQALRRGELHEIVRRTWDMLSHESADPTLRSDVATAYAELLTCVGLYDAAILKHRLAVAESDRSGDMLNGLQARIRLSVASLFGDDMQAGRQVDRDLANWPVASVERYVTSMRLLQIEWAIKRGHHDQAARRLAELAGSRTKATGFEGLNEQLTQARLHEATGEFEAAIAAASALRVDAQAFSHDQARADEVIYRAAKHLGRHEQAVTYGRRICRRLAEWRKSLDALPEFEATGELTIARQVARLHQRHALLDRLATLAKDQARVVAHEVRNALAPVAMVASLPEDSTASNLATAGSAPTGTNVDPRLPTMIDHALSKLDFVESRLDIAAPVADLGPVDLAGIVAEVTTSFQRTARSKSVELTATAEPLVIESDRAIIDMALSNVISNAIKFTEPNSQVRVDMRSRTGSDCVIAVSDQGAGFTSADMANAFHPHSRLSARPTGGETSTGLGLYISKRMLSGIGGSIRIDNRHDGTRGAEVVVTLPVGPPSRDPASDVAGLEYPDLESTLIAPNPPSRSRPTCCLVVEDSPPIVDMVRTVLERAGVEVIAAASPADVALVLSNKGYFDLALIDIDLGAGPNGAHVAELLRRHRPETRLVIASSMSASEAGRYASLHGLELLPKPFGAQALLRVAAPDQADARDPAGAATLELIGADGPESGARVQERFNQLETDAERLAVQDQEAGVEAYREALAFASLYEHWSGVAQALWRIGELSAALGSFANQIDALIELASSELTEPTDRARALQALGWAYLDRRAPTRAARAFLAAARFTPALHELHVTLAFGAAVCDLVENPTGDLGASLCAISRLDPDLVDRSPFHEPVQRWIEEVRSIDALATGVAEAGLGAGVELSTLARARLEALALGDPTAADPVLACDALDELARRLGREVEDLFSVYDLFAERAALRNRRDLESEFAALNDDLFVTLRQSSEHTSRFVGRIRDLLHLAIAMTDRAELGMVLDEIDRASQEFDDQARRFNRPKLHTPVPIVVAHLIRATQRLAAGRRIVLVWSPFEPGSAIDGAALGDLQAALTTLIADLEPGSTVEIGLELDPPTLVAGNVISPLD